MSQETKPKKCNIVPAGHNIIVALDPTKEKVSEGGIVLETEAKASEGRRQQQTGTVMAIGFQAFKAYCHVPLTNDVRWGEPWCKVGDRIGFKRWAGQLQVDPISGEEFLVMNDGDVTCILPQEASK